MIFWKSGMSDFALEVAKYPQKALPPENGDLDN